MWYLLTRKCCSLALSWKVWTICVGIQPHSLPPSKQLHAQKYCAIPSTPIASQSSRAHLTIRIGGYNTITDNKTSLTIQRRATIPHSHFNNNNFRPPFSSQNTLPSIALNRYWSLSTLWSPLWSIFSRLHLISASPPHISYLCHATPYICQPISILFRLHFIIVTRHSVFVWPYLTFVTLWLHLIFVTPHHT